MKQAFAFILFLSLIENAFAQDKKYDSLWSKTERLSNGKGLTASALDEVKKIYTLAKKENNDAQLLKALIYQAELQEAFEENAEQKSINEIEVELKSMKEPAASVLNSILAEKYWNYFQQHRWQFYGRTETTFIPQNLETWTGEQFHRRITQLYLASVKNEKLLQQTSIERYEPIVVKGNARTLRPTLFDLLANRAIEYFRNDESDVTKPAYAFAINENMAFADAETFVRHKFLTADSFSLQHKAIELFQRLISFHLPDSHPEALIDADLNRLSFIKQYGQMEKKDSLYLSALETLTKKFTDYKTGGAAYYQLAQWYADEAASYQALIDTSHRFDYLKAQAIAERIIEVNKENAVASSAAALLEIINRQHLELTSEKFNIPGQPFRTLVNFRNIDKLFLRVVQLSDAMKKELVERYDDKYWQQLSGLTALRSWSQQLPATNDHQQHAVEIKVDALPSGNYLLLASADQAFRIAGQVLAAQFVYVSNISYINNKSDYFVLHRQSGKPLVNTAVQVWNYQYDYNTRKNVLKPEERLTADEHGFFRIKQRPASNANIRLEFMYQDEHLLQDDFQYGIFRDQQPTDPALKTAEGFEKANARVFFFTDRSLYRPGQKVYFKGIVVTRDFKSRKSKILVAHNSTVRLYDDLNGNVLDSLQLTTNEYGSFNGSFQLPENGLNGAFRISEDQLQSQSVFSVEEYKRPKFYVQYENLKGGYRLNDSILVRGVAKAYAGNNINGATVSYSVVREARFPYEWLFSKWGLPGGTRMEIAHGYAKTDADGKFSVFFKAIPDASINSKLQPVFYYTITSNITDVNGETRTGEQTFPVSYNALQIQIQLPSQQKVNADSLKKIMINTTNVSGQHEPALVKLQVFRLEAPSALLKDRLWPRPDMYIMNKEMFKTFFPNDVYADEDDYKSWKRLEKVFEVSDSSRINTPFEVNTSKITEGWYVIEATTKDKWGEEIKDLKYVDVYTAGNRNMASPTYSWTSQTVTALEPGGKTSIGIGSAANDLFVIQHIDRELPESTSATDTNERSIDYNFLSLNKEKKWIDFTAREEDRGGFGVEHLFVKDNRLYVLSNVVAVPWTNKELSISYQSFRDKTLPGSSEKWKIKINGDKSNFVAAEMLASMYDASLDQFKRHMWTNPGIWPVYYNLNRWNRSSAFSTITSQERFPETKGGKNYSVEYDRLIVSAGRRIMVRGMAAASQAAPFAANKIEGKAVSTDLAREAAKPAEELSSQSLITANQPATTQTLQPRKNFNETAFFFPDLKTDEAGNIEFGFTIPEALTRWKFQAFSHTKELAMGLTSKEIITQKELMVQPNAPRFLREGDRIELSTKIVNLSAKEITGTIELQLFNAATLQPVDGWFQNAMPNQYFTAAAGESVAATFRIEVPYQYNGAVVYRFTARSVKAPDGSTAFSDGEEASLPVLTNSILVTESLPLPVNGNQQKNFSFDKLLNSGNSETLKHHALTVEFSSNPAWYAVQALPFLAVPTVESADHIFNRYYANAIAFKIANSSPRVRDIFQRWKDADSAALLSNLQKNQELKSVLLEETPWVLEAKTEAAQKKNIALLFDMMKMGNALTASLSQLKDMQSSNGGFMWFKGGPDDRYITQYILAAVGHLKKLDAIPASAGSINEVVAAALRYLDERVKDDYTKLLKQKNPALEKNHLGYLEIQYLYMRSFFNEYPIPGASFNAVNYYRKQSQQYWLQQSKYMQGMIALSLFRTGDKMKAFDIIKSLKENSVYSEEMGRYWRQNVAGYYWYQAPVETQSLLTEAFSEILQDVKTTNELKTWLLKQKQTQNWKTSKATADACYVLLMNTGSNQLNGSWLNKTPEVTIGLGSTTIRSNEVKEEAGTGYFRLSIDAAFVKPSMGNISVKVSEPKSDGNSMPSWGAVYWQYFERLDKITGSTSPLKLQKQLFIEKNTDRGAILQQVKDGDVLHTGDKIKVRIELTTDRDMEYIHLKDMRASCMEPVNVISGYRWQSGTGYYETTKDASTSFFFNWLRKGTYVFEYPMFVAATGNFSNGITTVQSLYAPEFANHGEGARVSVE